MIYKQGFFRQREGYKSFEPTPLEGIGWRWSDPKTDILLEKATRLLGELNAYSTQIPDVDFFIEMHIYKEATSSSRIEGTMTDINEALLPVEEVQPERRNDWEEVQNYIRALNFSIARLTERPLSVNLLKETHRVLLSGVRGQDKAPGEFKTTQNWIGGSGPADAFFVPAHQEGVTDLMGDLQKFWHDENVALPKLVKNAISHYQFETIHPFADGNGRIGRLLITLYFIKEGFLRRPTLYLSDYLERNRSDYYDALDRVRTKGDMEGWLRFYLRGVIETAEKGSHTLDAIVQLKQRLEGELLSLGGRAKRGQRLLHKLFSHPTITTNEAAAYLDVSFVAANNLISELHQKGILREVTGASRNRLFVLHEYITLFN
jgi:Fic family protein